MRYFATRTHTKIAENPEKENNLSLQVVPCILYGSIYVYDVKLGVKKKKIKRESHQRQKKVNRNSTRHLHHYHSRFCLLLDHPGHVHGSSPSPSPVHLSRLADLSRPSPYLYPSHLYLSPSPCHSPQTA
ncbi:hypothetical protein AX15_002379 [Amanita polypyramis BW_CC]|nr:hypothetical protein AX15_002379 [Amanita polypyramis BW_CC]